MGQASMRLKGESMECLSSSTPPSKDYLNKEFITSREPNYSSLTAQIDNQTHDEDYHRSICPCGT